MEVTASWCVWCGFVYRRFLWLKLAVAWFLVVVPVRSGLYLDLFLRRLLFSIFEQFQGEVPYLVSFGGGGRQAPKA